MYSGLGSGWHALCAGFHDNLWSSKAKHCISQPSDSGDGSEFSCTAFGRHARRCYYHSTRNWLRVIIHFYALDATLSFGAQILCIQIDFIFNIIFMLMFSLRYVNSWFEQVSICGKSATVLSSNSTQLLFLSPKFLSTALNDQFSPYEHQVRFIQHFISFRMYSSNLPVNYHRC
jgi:hypothetical protein